MFYIWFAAAMVLNVGWLLVDDVSGAALSDDVRALGSAILIGALLIGSATFQSRPEGE